MKELSLSNSGVSLVDDDVFEWADKFTWRRHSVSDRDYVCRYIFNPKSSLYLHREIMNPPIGMVVDHIDGDSFNNLRSNLRICTPCQNMQNMKKGKKKGGSFTSTYKGVSWSKTYKCWTSQITVNHKRIFVGNFVNEIDAALAYNEASLKYHGEFGKINEIKT